MYRISAPKRTGIYRVSGNMSDFQMEIKLRHISEWLPVPKFEYTGAKSKPSSNASTNGDQFSDSPLSSAWGDFFIYVPHEDLHGNYYNYYNYYNPCSEYASSVKASGFDSGSGSRSSFTAFGMNSGSGSGSGSRSVVTDSSTGRSFQSRRERDRALESSEELGSFYAQNKELCNGGTANLCISWQQKHFSRTELQRYGDAAQCVTTLQRRYHRWTQDILELQQRHQREVERHQAELRLRRRRGKHKERERERARERDRDKGTTPISSLGISDYSLEAPSWPEDPNFAARTCLIHTLIDADLTEMGDEEVQQLHKEGYQLMHVYAQLQQDILLLTLRYSPAQGLLYVYPDFNLCADDMEYVLEIDNDCRQLYAYGFQTVRPSLRPFQAKEPLYHQLKQETRRELEDLDDDDSYPPSDASAENLLAYYESKRLLAAERRRLLNFAVPPKRMRRVSLLLELRHAQHFEYDNIHVRYYVNPPLNTLLEPSSPENPFPLRGATATCLSTGRDKFAAFSHCWQLTLLCEETYQPTDLLHIYFEVISIDSWQRERCEGYAHFSCSLLGPLPASVVDGIRLQCIRPVGSWLDALNRYFIGGRKLFDFVGYFNGSSTKSSLHSRLELDKSCAMRSTGILTFSMRKVQQRQLQLGHHLRLDDDDSDDDSYLNPGGKASAPATTLDEVLAAYVDARERIEALLGHAAAL